MDGCAYCGLPAYGHGQREHDGWWHLWEAPTLAQYKMRLKLRLNTKGK